MIRIEFTEEAIDVLAYGRYHHPHPKVKRKMDALYRFVKRKFSIISLKTRIFSVFKRGETKKAALPRKGRTAGEGRPGGVSDRTRTDSLWGHNPVL